MPRTGLPAMTPPGRGLLREFARLLLVAVVVPVLVLAALILWQRDTTTREQFGRHLEAVAESTGHEVDNFLRLHLVPVQLLAERRSEEGSLDDSAAWAEDLLQIHRHYPGFTSLLVTDAEGNVRTIQPEIPGLGDISVADRSYFLQPRTTGDAYISNAFRGRYLGGDPLVTVSAPLFRNGRFAGVIQGAIEIEGFAALRSHWLQARGFEVLLLDRDQTVVHASEGLPYRSLDVLGDNARDKAILTLQRASDRTRMQRLPGVLSDGGDAYARAVPLQVGWRMLLLVPDRVVAAESRRNMLVIIVLLALVLVGVLTIVHMQMKRLGGSVHELLDRMQRFALDRASPPVEPDSVPRELAPLAEAMNQLASRAHEAYGEVNLSLQQQSHLREELQAVTRRLLTVQEDERRTLSRELHDDIGQAITAIKLGAMAIQTDDDPERRDEVLAEIIATTDQTVTKLRNLSLLLRPPQLDTLGLETALRWQADKLFRAGQPRLQLALSPLPHRPDPEVELACFRIAQEALTNVLRHASASRVTLTLAVDAEREILRLTIADDGSGFTADGVQGLGLVTMRERAQQVGGVLEIETRQGGGTCIRARLPMHLAR